MVAAFLILRMLVSVRDAFNNCINFDNTSGRFSFKSGSLEEYASSQVSRFIKFSRDIEIVTVQEFLVEWLKETNAKEMKSLRRRSDKGPYSPDLRKRGRGRDL